MNGDNVFFTSDTHFGHSNIIKYCGRPFSSIEEHDKTLIENWNRTVAKNATVYHLGDMMFKMPLERRYDLFKKLNGHIHFIMGNHDREGQIQLAKDCGLIKSVDQIKVIKVDGQQIVLCHYAMYVWPHKHHCAWHLFGHSHGNISPLAVSRNLWLDVGVDAVAKRLQVGELPSRWPHISTYRPVSFTEIKDYFERNY